MNNTLSKIIIFTAGAAVGSAVSWKYFKTKYERIANEEIESVKDLYKNKCSLGIREAQSEGFKTGLKETITKKKEEKKADRAVAKAIVEEAGYTNYDKEEGDEGSMDKPYIIPPEELGEDYEVESFNYYADGILADDYGNIIKEEDYGDLIGTDFADHFGEYENDSVFVRNVLLEKDYEILLDPRKYSDVYPSSGDTE